ncbi:transposase [Asticcacaulis sp.]|uniref:transposase n=1 Tax=Asticcacaulis sp. TaxID=1872648 RepID=UPI0039E5B1DF
MGQNLHPHPYIHCIVRGGRAATDGSGWGGCRPRFFLPVKVLSLLFLEAWPPHSMHAHLASRVISFISPSYPPLSLADHHLSNPSKRYARQISRHSPLRAPRQWPQIRTTSDVPAVAVGSRAAAPPHPPLDYRERYAGLTGQFLDICTCRGERMLPPSAHRSQTMGVDGNQCRLVSPDLLCYLKVLRQLHAPRLASDRLAYFR